MKRLSGLTYILIMFIIAFSASMAGYVSGVRASERKTVRRNAVSLSSPFMEKNYSLAPRTDMLPIINTDTQVTTTYVLREEEGKLALFSQLSSGEESLYQTYDISVNLLPKSDRELLSKGIEAQTLSDALQLIEDYSS